MTSDVFDRIYRDYLQRISDLDFVAIQGRLGLRLSGGELAVPFFGFPYRISRKGIEDEHGNKPGHDICVVLSKYLLMSPELEPPQSPWVTYKDFKDAAPFVDGFTNNVEKKISREFSGRPSSLRAACRSVNGRPAQIGTSHDLCMEFEALPKVPVLLLFNDADEEFPAQCTLLFEKRAEKYLDMECLAIVAMVLARWLITGKEQE